MLSLRAKRSNLDETCANRGLLMPSEIGVQEAKNHLAALLRRVARGEQFTITRYRRPIASLAPIRSGDRKTPRKGNLAEFFAESPLQRAKLTIERLPGRLRDVEL